MNKIKALEGVFGLDAAEHMDTALPAGVSLDDSILVHDMELVPVGGHRKILSGDDANHREEGPCRLPALGAPACMVMGHVAFQSDCDLVLWAFAVQIAARKVWVARCDAVVN